ncbi:MAG: bifunctional diguanylate cyclase/phosphodiesterase [Lachnospiraceae bacterium]|nr:bifunctional diguanylate cyclase/phosphodiesterase [Lachnospiraceae bacterium]
MDDLKFQIDYLTAINDKLVDSDKSFRFITESTGSLYIYQDLSKDGEIELIGPWDEYTGEKIMTLPFNGVMMRDYIYKNDLEPFLDNIWNLVQKKETSAGMKLRSRDKKYTFDVRTNIQYDENGNPLQRMISFTDITEYEQKLKKLKKLAYYDPLTNLYNGYYFTEKLKGLIRQADENNEAVELLILDIDDFKGIGSKIGLLYENELIEDLAITLRKYENKYTILGHLKKDVFAFAILDPNKDNCAVSLYDSVNEDIYRPIGLSNGNSLKIFVSGGIAGYPESAHSAEELIYMAEMALMNAKASGKNHLELFSKDLADNYDLELQTDAIIKEALEKDRFELYFQPQFDIGSQKVRGAEALLRFFDDNKKLILEPDEIIRRCENTGLIKLIGDMILDKALKAYVSWRDKYGYSKMLTINLSAMQLESDDIITTLERYIYELNIDPSLIELECKEEAFINNINLSISKLNTLKKIGFKICLDNYGIGYSPLSYLKDIPINTLKFDRTFMWQMRSDQSVFTIANAIKEIAKDFNIELVAEGIENIELLDIARKLECSYVQGYLLSKPVRMKDYEKIFMQDM